MVVLRRNALRVADDVDANLYPMPITSTGSYDVEVGRIRQNDIFGDKGLDFFACGRAVTDAGRIGAAAPTRSI